MQPYHLQSIPLHDLCINLYTVDQTVLIFWVWSTASWTLLYCCRSLQKKSTTFLYLDGLSFSGPEHNLLCLQLNLSHQCCKVCLHTGPENESPPEFPILQLGFMKWGQLIVGDQQQVDSHQKTVQAPLAKLPKAQAQPCFPQHLCSFFLFPLLHPVNHPASIHVSCLRSSLCRAQLACLHNTKLY